MGKKFALLLLIVASLSFLGNGQDSNFLRVNVGDSHGICRILIESSEPLKKDIEKSGSFLFIKIRDDSPLRFQRQPFSRSFVRNLDWSAGRGFYTLALELRSEAFSFSSFSVKNPPQLYIKIQPHGAYTVEEEKEVSGDGIEPPPPPQIDTSTRLRTIVIDPGHGGMESGAQGKIGALEKDITLEISKKLKSIIEKKRMLNVILTRDSDVAVSLESRAAIANNQKAFLFISIHTNSSYRKKARGSETFFLSLNATDQEARRLAYLENNQKELGEDVFEDSGDDIKMILWDMAQAAYLRQSSQLAEFIQQELNALLGTANRGVKQAPFSVLSGVACPAVLVEVAFISNPEEEKKLQDSDFQNNVAQAIYRGLNRFIEKNVWN